MSRAELLVALIFGPAFAWVAAGCPFLFTPW